MNSRVSNRDDAALLNKLREQSIRQYNTPLYKEFKKQYKDEYELSNEFGYHTSESNRKPWLAYARELDNKVTIYEFNRGKFKPLFFWEAHESQVNALVFLEDGSLATGGGGH